MKDNPKCWKGNGFPSAVQTVGAMLANGLAWVVKNGDHQNKSTYLGVFLLQRT